MLSFEGDLDTYTPFKSTQCEESQAQETTWWMLWGFQHWSMSSTEMQVHSHKGLKMPRRSKVSCRKKMSFCLPPHPLVQSFHILQQMLNFISLFETIKKLLTQKFCPHDSLKQIIRMLWKFHEKIEISAYIGIRKLNSMHMEEL